MQFICQHRRAHFTSILVCVSLNNLKCNAYIKYRHTSSYDFYFMLRTIWQTYCFAEYVSPINNVCMSSRSSSTQLLHSLKVLVVELVVLNYFIH